MEEILNALVTGVVGVVVALIGVATSYATAYIRNKTNEAKSKTSENEWRMIQSIAGTMVNAVEQIARTVQIDSKAKLRMAVDMSVEEAQRRGIKVTREQFEPIVEAGVKALDDLDFTLDELISHE